MGDAVGEIFISQGCRYFSKSANPNFGIYRNGSTRWRLTSKNMKARHDYKAGRKTRGRPQDGPRQPSLLQP